MFEGLDPIAIAVPETEAALKVRVGPRCAEQAMNLPEFPPRCAASQRRRPRFDPCCRFGAPLSFGLVHRALMTRGKFKLPSA